MHGLMHHGAPAIWEIVAVVVVTLVVTWVLYLAVRYTLAPGESSPDHIKRRILEENAEAAEPVNRRGSAPRIGGGMRP